MKMLKIEGYIELRGGRLAMKDREKFFESLRSLPDGLYTMLVEFVYDARTSPQNRYYWGVVVKAYVHGARETWGEMISSNDAHQALKLRFNFKEYTNVETGEIITMASSTKELSTVKFAEYTEHCRNFIQEWFNIETPDPE